MTHCIFSHLRRCVGAPMVALFIAGGTALPAVAGPVVLSASSYSMFIAGETSGVPLLMSTVFDGLAQNFSRAGLSLSLTEFETDLGGGSTRITLQLRADGDLFSSPGEGGIVGLALDGDGLDLSRSVRLDDARIQLFDANAVMLGSSGNLAEDYAANFHLSPWDGYFAFPGNSFIFINAGGHDIEGVSLQFTVSDISTVDEPTALPLVALALACGWAAPGRLRRRLGVLPGR